MLFWLTYAARGLLRRRARSVVTLVATALGIAVLVFFGALMSGINDTMIANARALHPAAELLPEVKQLTDLNQASMLIGIVLVVLVMTSGVVNTVLVSVMDRYRDFGILKALGTEPRQIAGLILLEATLLALVAGIAGLVVGAVAVAVTARTGIDLAHWVSANPHFALTTVVHPRLTVGMSVLPPVAVLVLGVLAALWPARIAAGRRPADVLRMTR